MSSATAASYLAGFRVAISESTRDHVASSSVVSSSSHRSRARARACSRRASSSARWAVSRRWRSVRRVPPRRAVRPRFVFNHQVCGDVPAAMARGRNCLVLTRQTKHVDTLAERLCERGHQPHTLYATKPEHDPEHSRREPTLAQQHPAKKPDDPPSPPELVSYRGDEHITAAQIPCPPAAHRREPQPIVEPSPPAVLPSQPAASPPQPATT